MRKNHVVKLALSILLFILELPAAGQIGKVDRRVPTYRDHRPTGLAWQDHYLWMIDYDDKTILKINPATGQILISFPAPDNLPTGLAWDGKNLWCSGTDTKKLYQLNEKGKILTAFSVTDTPRGVVSIKNYLWYIDSNRRQIYQVDPDYGALLDSIPAPASSCRGLAFDGKYLWCSDRVYDEIYKIDMKRKKIIMIIKSPAQYSYGLTWDERCMWIAGYDSRALFRIFVTGTNRTTLLDSLTARIHYKLTVKNTRSSTISLNTWMCKPYNSMRQRLDSRVAWYPASPTVTFDQWRQEFAHYNESVAPGDSVIHTMTVNMTNYDLRYYLFPEEVGTLGDIPVTIRTMYTVDGDKYDIHDPVIHNAVTDAIGSETKLYWQVRNIHDYIIEHLRYRIDDTWEPAPQVLTQGHGSCSEYTFVFIAMCRKAGIPARYEAGGYLGGDMPYTDTVFHRWHQVYLPPYGWMPVDATWDDKELPADQVRYFGATSVKLFATTLGGGDSDKIAWAYNSANNPSSNLERAKEMRWTEIAQPKLILSQNMINFGSVPVGNFRDIQVTVANMGKVNLTIFSTEIIGQNPKDFSLPRGVMSDIIIPPAGSVDLTIRFTANVAGSKSAYLVFTSDAPSSPDTVAMRGTGLATAVTDQIRSIPETFYLEQNYPNPFNPQTTIPFGIARPAEVTFTIYNANGSMVTELFNGRKQPGHYAITWDAANYPSGTYFIRMKTVDFMATKRCILVK